jgi:hypothetical protein
MTTIIQGTQLRDISLGRYVQGQRSTIAAGGGVKQLFTVAGGEVLITALWGKVTTAITLDTETLALQIDPTTGTTVVWVTATDLGTTDTAVGDILGVKDQGDGTTDFKVNGEALRNYIATTGEIELDVANVTGTEVGVIDWFCTWVPLTSGATVVAATT